MFAIQTRREIPTHGNGGVLDFQNPAGTPEGWQYLIHRGRRAGEPHPFDVPFIAVLLRIVDIDRTGIIELVIKDQAESWRGVRLGVVCRRGYECDRVAILKAGIKIVEAYDAPRV